MGESFRSIKSVDSPESFFLNSTEKWRKCKTISDLFLEAQLVIFLKTGYTVMDVLFSREFGVSYSSVVIFLLDHKVCRCVEGSKNVLAFLNDLLNIWNWRGVWKNINKWVSQSLSLIWAVYNVESKFSIPLKIYDFMQQFFFCFSSTRT